MEIKFLKAGQGDSILVHHNGKNILIDGGNDTSFLMRELHILKAKNEFIDLLIITHHDDDHIAGILEVMVEIKNGKFGEEKDFIKSVIFNSPLKIEENIVKTKNVENYLSYKQAHELETLLNGNDINTKWENICTEQSASKEFDDLVITFLSPTINELKKYYDHKPELLSNYNRCDWNTSMNKLDKYLNDDCQDNSISNKSSIVTLIKCDNKKILLTGDVTPDRLLEIINNLITKNGKRPVEFDYIKLPHHGSYRNLNKEILSNITCNKFIILTNGLNSYLPNKRTFLKISKYLSSRGETNYFFNYGELIDSLKIHETERTKYKIVLTPNNFDNGYSI